MTLPCHGLPDFFGQCGAGQDPKRSPVPGKPAQPASRYCRCTDTADTLIHVESLLPSLRRLDPLQVVNQQGFRCHDRQFNADLHQERTRYSPVANGSGVLL